MAREWKAVTDSEFEKQFLNLKGDRPEDPFAADAVFYDEQGCRIVVEFKNGCLFAFPAKLAQGLSSASTSELREGRVITGGETLRWDRLDVDLSVEGLLRFLFGSDAWMKHLGRAGGQSTSKAKAAAARTNGLKGGRPRKQSNGTADSTATTRERKALGHTTAAGPLRAKRPIAKKPSKRATSSAPPRKPRARASEKSRGKGGTSSA